jgi:outer membrane protein assembly factor BamB
MVDPTKAASLSQLFAERLCGAVFVLSVCGGATVAQADAPAMDGSHTVAMFRCNPQQDALCLPQGASTPNIHPQQTVWKFRTGHLNRSSPIAVGDLVYVGSNDGNLYALELGTGKARWTFHTDGELTSSPAYAQGRVYVTGGDGQIYALDATNGRLIWTFRTGSPFGEDSRWDFYQSSPTLVAGTLYVGSGDGHVYALDAASGKQRWAFKADGRVRATPTVSEGVVYVGSMGGTLYALDALHGEPRWTFKTAGNAMSPEGDIQSSAAVAGGLVYVGSRDGALYALDAKTGKQRWVVDDHEGAWVTSSPAVADGILYVGTSDTHKVLALDASNGNTVWTFDAQGRVFASPVVVDGRVYVGLGQSTVVRLNAKTGKVEGRAYSEGTIYSSVALQGNLLIYSSDDGYIYAAK